MSFSSVPTMEWVPSPSISLNKLSVAIQQVFLHHTFKEAQVRWLTLNLLREPSGLLGPHQYLYSCAGQSGPTTLLLVVDRGGAEVQDPVGQPLLQGVGQVQEPFQAQPKGICIAHQWWCTPSTISHFQCL